jgi:phi13 family phage major tail protein
MAVAAPNIYEYRGVEGLVYAEVTCDDNSSETGHGYVTGTVKPLAGVAELGKTNDGTTEAHWYDNLPAVSVDNNGTDTVTIQASAIPLQVLAEITGQEYDSTTGMLIEGHRQTKYFAIGYRTGTVGSADDKEVYVWRLKGTFAIPEETHATENNGTDANGQELVYTGIYTTHKFEKTGKNELAVVIDTGLDLIKDKDTFFDTVQTPDTVTAKA